MNSGSPKKERKKTKRKLNYISSTPCKVHGQIFIVQTMKKSKIVNQSLKYSIAHALINEL